MPISALQPFMASQLFIYGFTAVRGFTVVSCNLMVTFGDAH